LFFRASLVLNPPDLGHQADRLRAEIGR